MVRDIGTFATGCTDVKPKVVSDTCAVEEYAMMVDSVRFSPHITTCVRFAASSV